MAKYSMSPETEDGMEDMYTQDHPQDAKGSIDEEEAEAMETSALVPMKLLQADHPEPPKVGEEYVVKVKEIHGDQAEIIYAPHKKGEGEEEDEESEHMMGDEDLEKMNNSQY